MGSEKRITISFKETEKEKELYEFIKEESDIIGLGPYIKQILYEKMLEKKRKVAPRE
jgi:hypothetical protein